MNRHTLVWKKCGGLFMNKTKIIGCIVVTVLLAMFIVIPSVTSKPIKLATVKESCLEFTISHEPVYVGDMYIEGTGNHETSLVMANAENDLKINVGLEGSDVVLYVSYLLQCPGLFDAGFARLWVQDAEEKEVETYDYAEGYLYTTVYDCKIGDYISWALVVIYDDLLFPYPLTSFDSGGGMCNRLILRNMGLRAQNTQTIMSGTIVCQ